MSSAHRSRSRRLLLALVFATLAFSLHAADASAQSVLSINDVTMNEGNAGTTTFTFTVTLSNPPPGNFTIMVNYATANGTATAGACASGGDYTSTSGSLTFNRNFLTRPVDVQVCGDTELEPDETFVVNLSMERPPPIVVLKRQGVGTIRNDDIAALRPTSTEVSCEDSSFEAGGSTNCTATVSDTGGGTKTTPTGTVDWSSDAAGTFVLDPCFLTPTLTVGVASCTVVFSSTVAAKHTITATYAGNLIHEGSTGSTTVTVTPGPPATVTLDPLAPPPNPVDTQHCVTATVADRFGNPTPGISVVFTVTGSNSTSGSHTTDANGEAEFCYIGRLFGVDTIDAFADTDDDGTRDLGEPSAVPPATKTWLLPPSTPLCEVEFPTGGGHIVAVNGDRASFGGNAHVSAAGDPSGQQEYQDHGPAQPLTVKSISVLAVVCVRFPDGHAEANIFGEATIDGSGRYAFRIDVEDHGEPGTSDTYWITLSSGYTSGKRPLEGGNITIH
jgi:hypothetical protein